MTKTQTTEEVLYSMLVENTGRHMLDSGGAYGRNFERNGIKSLEDFKNEDEVTPEFDADGNLEDATISVFHFLRQNLDRDSVCEEFDKINTESDNYDSERFRGVSKEAENFLPEDVHCIFSENSYNRESSLSQVIQYSVIEMDDENGFQTLYVLLQIHGGCDIRGGYTDARLFLLTGDEYSLAEERIFGQWTPNNVDLDTPTLFENVDVFETVGGIRFDNCYDGYSFTDERGNPVVVNQDTGRIDLYLCID